METYAELKTKQTKKLNRALSEKGKKLIWNVVRHYVSGGKAVFDFRSQEYLPLSLSFSVNN